MFKKYRLNKIQEKYRFRLSLFATLIAISFDVVKYFYKLRKVPIQYLIKDNDFLIGMVFIILAWILNFFLFYYLITIYQKLVDKNINQ